MPLYQRLNHKGDCWDECNLNGRGQGPCDWCGLEGLCCRKGSNWIGNGCDGAIGEWDHHKCVSKPGNKWVKMVGVWKQYFATCFLNNFSARFEKW